MIDLMELASHISQKLQEANAEVDYYRAEEKEHRAARNEAVKERDDLRKQHAESLQRMNYQLEQAEAERDEWILAARVRQNQLEEAQITLKMAAAKRDELQCEIIEANRQLAEVKRMAVTDWTGTAAKEDWTVVDWRLAAQSLRSQLDDAQRKLEQVKAERDESVARLKRENQAIFDNWKEQGAEVRRNHNVELEKVKAERDAMATKLQSIEQRHDCFPSDGLFAEHTSELKLRACEASRDAIIEALEECKRDRDRLKEQLGTAMRLASSNWVETAAKEDWTVVDWRLAAQSLRSERDTLLAQLEEAKRKSMEYESVRTERDDLKVRLSEIEGSNTAELRAELERMRAERDPLRPY